MTEALAPSERHQYRHVDGRVVYEWDQTAEEVNVYIRAPQGVDAKQLVCDVGVAEVVLGIRGLPPYLKERPQNAVKSSESFWTLEDGEIHITMQKAERALPWPCAFAGHCALDPLAQRAESQRLLLERFQAEHPGFDFSGAEVTGDVPDPSKFMGGARTT